jgi:hypothetical protein
MPTCVNGNLLVLNNPCLSAKVLTQRQLDSLRIWFMAKELAANGGTNYTAVLASTLLTDSNSYAQNLKPDQRVTASLVIDKSNATTAGASIASDPDELMASIAPLSKATDAQLEAMTLLLKCKLGAHRSPPA